MAKRVRGPGKGLMMRIGFTIIYNGKHHLEHKNWGWRLPAMLDAWIVVEGAAQPGGSTFWCNRLDAVTSDDGTIELLEEIMLKNGNMAIIKSPERAWFSKDEMVNTAAEYARIKYGRYGQKYLWQFDIDEQWTPEQLDIAEYELRQSDGKCGCFHADYFLGDGIVAKGQWGEGDDPLDALEFAYRRLWLWNGQKFLTHEPPMLQNGNGREILLSPRFDHYSYYFEKDVLFKQKYYKGYDDIHKNWQSLQKERKFPQPINRLLGGFWGDSRTMIMKLTDK
jgi:hypothetical protein